jgi:hypothetical protein
MKRAVVMATTAATHIHFQGSPRVIEGLVPFEPQPALTITLSLDLKQARAARHVAPLALEATPVGSSAMRLQFSLPESTPPGAYEGSVQIGGESYPITVEVQPHPYLVISPRQLSLQVAPGAEASVDLTLVNSGNVSCEITKVHAFGLFDVKGVERSIGVMLGTTVEKGQGRLDRFMDEAADSHGGLVRVIIKEGAGSLGPSELRNVRAALRFSERLKPDQTYWGTWPLLNLKYYVRVSVISPDPAAVKSPRKQKESS